ncbi:MAG: hypothetical protein OQK23_01745 [Rhodospirillales bacterium]|nr:hypothetical protein [Rhodospirillales bacterium]
MGETGPKPKTNDGATDFSDWPRGSAHIFTVHFTKTCTKKGSASEVVHARTKDEARVKAQYLRPHGKVLRIEKMRKGAASYPSARFINGKFLAGTVAEERRLLDLAK